jgi:ParB family transcriptional regulator, chromosome partitioning protein
MAGESVLESLRNNRSRQLVAARSDDLVSSSGVISDPANITQLRSRITELEKTERTLYVDPLLIDRSPFQPRKHFDPIEQATLTASVEEWGVLFNLIVRVVNVGRYELVAGERRQISAIAAKRQVPIKVMELSDRDARRIALAENLNRVDLNCIEETWGILNLLSVDLNIDSTEDVKKVLYNLNSLLAGKKLDHNVMIQLGEQQKIVENSLRDSVDGMTIRSFVVNRLPLLNLPSDVIESIEQGLEYTKARAIAKVDNSEQRTDLLRCAAEGMSLMEIKKQIKALKPLPEAQQLTPKERLQLTLKQVSKSKVWEDADKWTKVDAILAQLDALLT